MVDCGNWGSTWAVKVTITCFTHAHTRLFQASILDLHSGALSVGKHFVNLYR